MKVIVVANNKGGVTKTTLARMLCEWYSRQGKARILCVDMDPQCSLSLRLLNMDFDSTSEHGVLPPLHPDYDPEDPADADWDGRSSIADIFYGEPVVPYPTELEHVDIAPGHGARLNEAEYVTVEESKRRVYNQLRQWFALDDVRNAYDIAVVDTPPKKGPLTIAAIRAATHVIIPTEMEQQSVEGLQRMLLLLKRESFARQDGVEARLAAIVPVKYRKVNLHKDFLASLMGNPQIGNKIPAHMIPHSIKVAETDVPGAVPPSILDIRGPVGQEAQAICRYITQQVFDDDKT
jgi:chromosome partitioning protein